MRRKSKNYVKVKYDHQRLKEEADIETVIDHLGLEVIKKGKSHFIRCPNPKHQDEHISNCYFVPGWNNVYCTVCNRAYMALDIIMFVTGCDIGTAAETLWEWSGCPSWYKKKETRKLAKYYPSPKDMELLEIKLPKRIFTLEYIDYHKMPGIDYSRNSLDYAHLRKENVSYQDFLSESELFQYILEKAKLKKKQIISLLMLPQDLIEKKQEEELLKKLERTQSIINHVQKDIQRVG